MARGEVITKNGARWAPFLLLALAAVAAAEVKIINLKDSGASEFNFHDEARGPAFVVGIGAAPSPSTRPSPGSRPLSITSNGTRYTCHLPSFDDSDADAATGELATSPAAAGVVPPEKTPEALLDALGDFCAYRVDGWWTYEVCYKQGARQYHSEAGKVSDSYSLGNYSATASDMTVPAVDADVGADMRYVRQAYLGGDPCKELPGSPPRSVEVRYVCSRGPATVLTEVREPRSCTYLFVVATPRLCGHSAFKYKIPQAAPIVCYPEGGAALQQGESNSGSGTSSVSAAEEVPLLGTGGKSGGSGKQRKEEEEAAVLAVVDGNPTGGAEKNATVAAELEDEVEGEDGVDGVAVNDLFAGPLGYEDDYDD